MARARCTGSLRGGAAAAVRRDSSMARRSTPSSLLGASGGRRPVVAAGVVVCAAAVVAAAGEAGVLAPPRWMRALPCRNSVQEASMRRLHSNLMRFGATRLYPWFAC